MKKLLIITMLFSFSFFSGLFAQQKNLVVENYQSGNSYSHFINGISNYHHKFIEKNILDTDSEYGAFVTDLGDFNGDGYPDFAVGAHQAEYNAGRVYIYFGGTEPDNNADLILLGESENAHFGVSVNGAGDLNSDGFDDIIIGRGANSVYQKCWIYFGGNNPDTIADVILTGVDNSDQFGFRVSGAGDVNNDDFDDVIVTDFGYNNDNGQAYIYYGGTVMDTVCDVVLSPNVVDTVYGVYFGNAVSGAGDVNNDGFDDVIIGSWLDDNSTGAAYIFFGGEGMDTNAIKIYGRFEEQIYSGNFGYSVSGAQDVNNDGFDDVLIGTSFNPSFSRGRAYLYFGSTEMDTVPDVIMIAENTDAYNFGTAVSGAGDIDNDGFDDIIIGAPGTPNTEGYIFVFHGGTEMDSIPDLQITGEQSEEYMLGGFGTSISSTGDINNDGFDDFIVGNNYYFNHAGKSYVFFGGSPADTIVDISLEGEYINNYFAYSASIVEDINNDGFDDVLLGAPGYQGDALTDFGTGRVYIYFGGSTSDTIADITLDGEWNIGWFGRALSSAGDFNNDGYNDFIVGAYNRAYLYFGGPQLDDIPDIVFEGDSWQYILGNSLAPAGDVNNDGFDDVIIGAWGGDDYQGQAFIYFGNDVYDNTADVSIEYSPMINYFGYSVSGIGDFNNDGFDDVTVGDFGMNYNGSARVYYGGATMDNVEDLTIYGEYSMSNFSRSMSPAGDFNDDGYEDWIVADESYNDIGRVYLLLGGDSPDGDFDLFFDGEENGSNFGWSVSGGSDFNNDGIPDIVVGACGSNTAICKTFIYFGGQSLDNTPDEIFEGEFAGDNFGYSVSCGGDINNDNKADIVVGAYLYPENGAAYLYLSDFNTSVEDLSIQATETFYLSQNNPNPFNISTKIQYQIGKPSKVTLKIYNSSGQEIRILINKFELPGLKLVTWNGKDNYGYDAIPGIYYYSLRVGDFSQCRKMVLIR